MADKFRVVGTLTWEQAHAVAETLSHGAVQWGWNNGGRHAYPTGSIEIQPDECGCAHCSQSDTEVKQ